MALLDYTGYAAALCTRGAYVPQVLRVWRTRSTQDISLSMFLVLVAGLTLWLVYGFWRGEIPLIAANGVTLVLAGTIFFQDQARVSGHARIDAHEEACFCGLVRTGGTSVTIPAEA